MCGIAGIVSLAESAEPPSLEQLGAMIAAIQHRGPDEFGLYRDERAGLAHARLSIIDIATGQQPLANEDGTLWVAFNGEIFNYLELRDELCSLGHRFRTSSDTEVIVHAFESWGTHAFDRFNGQWAVALWDSRRRALTLARDPLGVRPLYHCEHQGRLYFASEVKAIFAAGQGIARAFDPVGLAEVFTFWAVVPPQTVFQGIAELEPGHARHFRNGTATDSSTWSAPFPQGDEDLFKGSLGDAVDATRSALEEATRLRMLRADVPVGSYLSGGLDSSLTAALGLRAKGTRFHTFSLRFEDAEYDETRFQRLMVERLGSEHHEVLVSRDDISRAFPEVCFHAERPVLRTAPAPLFLLSGLVRGAGIKAVLTGEGADEVFGGYDVFREGKVRRFWAREPTSSRRPQLLARLYPYLARSPVARAAVARQFFGRNLAGWRRPGFAHEPRWHSAASLHRLFAPEQQRAAARVDVVARLLDRLPPEFVSWSFLAQDQYLEVRTLLSGYLLSAQGDRMLMGHSVEGRFPFLDRNVVTLANSFPASFKLRVLDEKHVLKRASEGLVPREIIARPKQPYRAPDALAFVGASPPDWLDVISEKALVEAGVFDPGAARRVYEKCRARSDEAQLSNADNMALVGVLSTQLVYDSLIRRRPGGEPPTSYRTHVDRLGGSRG